MNFWKNKKVLVTGGNGFIGRHLTAALKVHGAEVKIPENYIVDQPTAASAVTGAEIIFHLAAHVGGIHYNQVHPGTLMYRNLLPTINLFEAARQAKIDRMLLVSSACVYSRFCTIPTPETEGFKDDPEPTNFGYGWSKRAAELLARTYSKEYGMKIGIVRPYNVYGPGDNFNPEQSHVIPGLIKRVIDGERPLTVWGDGTATRSFIYVKDVLIGMMLALEKYPQPDPINLGTAEEISIKRLAQLIIKLSGKKTPLRFDRSKPNGQPRRRCDTAKAKKILGFTAKTKLVDGLKPTIDFYRYGKE